MNTNPFTAPLQALKQIGEQTNAAIQQMGTSVASVASTGLDGLINIVPGLPGRNKPAPARRGVPTAKSLLPAGLTQALGRVEDLIIPAGLPRPSAVLGGKAAPPPPPPAQPPAPAPTATPPAARRRVSTRRGM